MKEILKASVPAPSRSGWPVRFLAVLLVVLLAWILRPVLAAIVIGGFVVLVGQKPCERLVVALRGRRGLAASLATAAVSLIVLVPVATTMTLAAREATDALRFVSHDDEAARALRALVAKLPTFVSDQIPAIVESAKEALLGLVGSLPPLVPRALASTTRLLISLLLTIVTMFFLFRDGPVLVRFLRSISPLSGAQTESMLGEVREVALGLFRGGVLVGVFHGTTAALGLFLFSIPHALLLGSLCAVASFVPLVGTGLIAVPLIAGVSLTGAVGKAIGLAIWFLVIVGASDQLLRPLVSKGQMALPRPLLFLTLFGGLQVFGPIGLLLGPLLGSLAVVALRLCACPSH